MSPIRSPSTTRPKGTSTWRWSWSGNLVDQVHGPARQKVELSEGETADWASMLSQAESLVDVEEQTPVENDIQWLMGQSEVKIAEGSLTPAGEETVNGVPASGTPWTRPTPTTWNTRG